jgi:SAM-dependent methyltransferase
MTDTILCPLCSKPAPHGQSECNSVHPTVALSWEHDSIADYEGWYASPDYHEGQYRVNRGQSCTELYDEAKTAAYARWRAISALLNDGRKRRVLDVGAGNMAVVDVARNFGHEAHGIDPHPLREDCQAGTWEAVRGQFDVITMFDVMEHLTEPFKALAHLKACLAPGGVMVIEMPELNAPNEVWKRHQKPKEHIFLYSREGAEFLYGMAGLTVAGFYRPVRCSLGKMSHVLQVKGA